ncbi:hypothetical protein HZU77_014420 [Neisseriaceae bacterium TC5R-5]|nr:hypothetical protein [Neisseriaceae bacterium TC5R-5]
MSAHITALRPALRQLSQWQRGQPIDHSDARQNLRELQDACWDGLHLLAELVLQAEQQQALSADHTRAAAYLQCLLSALGSECSEWLNQLELDKPFTLS